MHSVIADFYRFNELTIDQIQGHDGVVVAYGSRAKARASFIFAGEIVTRLKDAWDKESLHSTDGFVALMGNEGKVGDLENAQLTRAILLMIGDHTDRGGIANIKDADFDKARRRVKLSNMIKLRVKGHDPLIPPWEKSALNEAKEVSVFLEKDEMLTWDSDHWKRRKKRLV
jgi:hypothetical protein